jgi:hypothetical protein
MKEFGHEGLAKAHDFVVGFSLRIKISAAFATTHRQGGQRILENLFERKEFKDTGINRGVEAQTAFVGADGAVHLDAKAAVHLDLTFVVDPGNAELNHPLRLDDPLQDFPVPILLVSLHDRSDRLENFGYRLKEFGLIGITLSDDIENFLNKSHSVFILPIIFLVAVRT